MSETTMAPSSPRPSGDPEGRRRVPGLARLMPPREPVGLARVLRRWAVLNLIAQVGIVVTGGLVRVTGSGLGCPTWPECFEGSVTPPAHAATGANAAIEFGNRTLTFVLGVFAVLVLATVLLLRRRDERAAKDRRLLALGAAPLLGVVAQALLGGVTVLVGLSPAWVGAHFLLSMVIIAASTVLLIHLRPAAGWDGARRPELRWAAYALVAATAVVLALGTLVTGAGPHAGDEDTPRYDLDIRALSWLHADAVLLLAGLAMVILVALRLTDAPEPARRWALALVAICATQAVIGYVQYAVGVPMALVLLHMLGASLLVVAVTGTVARALRPPISR